MNETIKDYLKDKTRVMITHNVQFLKHSDYIYVMDEGKVSAEGSYQQIQQNDSIDIMNKLKEFQEVRAS
jgi:ABC-type bacteriocin/lantibiotic exporter with double-glycine peptidase domain